MNDLGTLGGSNALALYINDPGQIAGLSDTSTMVNPKTKVPPQHPFLWDPHSNHGNGKMRDVGTLGGTLVSSIGGINQRGQFVGQMSLADEQSFHAFKWNGSKLLDLGTFGGPNSNPLAINELGWVVGEADYPTGCSGPAQHAVLWRHGAMTDLGVISGTVISVANGINAKGQVVGASFSCDFSKATAFLWERGRLYDLNKLIASSSMYLDFALEINDRGEIAGDGLVNGVTHAVVLIPCEETKGDCGGGVARGATAPVALPPSIRNILLRREGRRGAFGRPVFSNIF